VRVLFQLVLLEQFENVLKHEPGDISLGEVGAVEAVETIGADDSSLVVSSTAFSTVDEHAVLFPHDIGLNNVDELVDVLKVVSCKFPVEIKVVSGYLPIVPLLKQICHRL
jgi:hypothetical protein